MSIERRSFLQASLKLCTAACVIPAGASAFTAEQTDQTKLTPETEPALAEQSVKEPERQLRLANVHTGEILDVVYWADGKYINDHVGQLNYFMRDHHAREAARMDRRLYDSLYRLQHNIGTDSRIHVLSAFRTSATNEALRKRLKDVAKNSYHMKGRAVDLYIPGVDAKIIQNEARQLGLGGVGYYTKRNFVHLDTGKPRFWLKS